ncbi:MAG: CoA-binding protein [Deltaproteobacteria bacterium]|nr:CoA-binding protein [Deltaproteobacteria bacterium]MBW2050926.1 CoA-binding protein [Deltaproteobacteria bacterium]MBW2141181.1 CoA-binding protein [Deltaproteobacteria bacterium]
MSQPEIVPELAPLFHPRSVAVIGATNNLTKWGFSTFYSLMRHYQGDLYAVNNRDAEILGYPAYAKITDIPGPVDLAVIVIPPEKVAGVMEECVEKEVKAGVIITAGFAEVGRQGKAMQDEVLRAARKGGIRLVGPNCMGMWSASANLTAFMFPLPIMEGPLSLVSQGGNVGGALVSDAVSRGVGFQHYISCGCTADIQIEDYIEYMGNDDSVKVIMVYIEGLADGDRFVKKVKPVTLKKPVVALKPGKTEAAARAISSHSGALSGSDMIYDAAFKKAGVIRTETTMELLDVAIGLLTQPLPRGRNVVITTPGGSYGVMCADACATLGLNVIDLPPGVMETFNEMFPSRWSHGNPVDPAGDRNLIQYLKAPDILLRYPEIDALIFMGFGSFSGISAMLTSAGGQINKRLESMRKRMKGFEQTARKYGEMLDSGDHTQIREIIEIGLGMLFGSVMATSSSDMEEFINMVSDALTSEQMRQSSFFKGLKKLFDSVAEGDLDAAKMADIMDLIAPMLDAIISHWICKYNKPVITTTFNEAVSRIGEGGHYPYSNAERASKVLAKLVEYAEFLESEGKKKAH